MRWLLAILGFVYGRWLGALAGYLVGSILDDMRKQIRRRNRPTPHEFELLEHLLALAVAIAKADGRLDRSEVRAIRRFFQERLGFQGPLLTWLRDALKSTVHHPTDPRAAAQRLASIAAPQERVLILYLLAEVARADGTVTAAERALLEEIAQTFGVPPGLLGGWFSEPTSSDEGSRRRWALGVLGLEEGASREEIDRAYRRLVREHHPDRFAHRGEAFVKLAHERFVEIQEAYRVLTS